MSVQSLNFFQNKEAADTFLKLEPTLIRVISSMLSWCKDKKLPFVITSCIRGMIPNVSKTNIHSDGRAIDISIKGWRADQITEFVTEFNARFAKELGAISIDDNISRVVIFHNAGAGDHLHAQLRRGV
jgi:hypothetical protein